MGSSASARIWGRGFGAWAACPGSERKGLPFAAFLTLLLCGSWERPVREQRFKITNI